MDQLSSSEDSMKTPTPPTTHMVNLSVTPPVVPATWRAGVVRPTFITDKHNYRPINISPLVYKLIENWLVKQLIEHLISHNRLHLMRFGFHTHSTEGAFKKLIAS